MTESDKPDLEQKNRIATWLFNPFYYLAGAHALALGFAVIIATGALGWVRETHLDGVLDLHSGASAHLWLFLAEGIIDWLSLAAVLCIAALVVSRTRFRPLDIFGTQALARVPAFFSVAATFTPEFREQALRFATFPRPPMDTASMAGFVAGIIVILACTVWMVVLMYRGFATSCNVRGGKAATAFIVGLLFAESLSKVLIIGLFLHLR